ncbi:hypothetical protein KP509_17G083100 [Ceratopteris richardii]|uniref:C2H2-type domain-containing protein n=1 Tax=Ceratopteris richardii TaxID=49495 RepID=A0A8T2SW01_CERRI|nr:hypothetical protein KP509_17G083100 [Ceratopteris richardii]
MRSLLAARDDAFCAIDFNNFHSLRRHTYTHTYYDPIEHTYILHTHGQKAKQRVSD